MKNNFLKQNGRIFFKPDGSDYSLKENSVYELFYDKNENNCYLEEKDAMQLPNKIYSTEKDDKFISRVIKYYSNCNNSLGVLFNGDKGCGKTFLMKRIAMQMNLPIIIIGGDFPFSVLSKFFSELKEEVCVLIDEVEKESKIVYRDQRYLLELLDGVQCNSKKIVLMTCNDKNQLNTNIIDRCSRIRYYLNFKANSSDHLIKEIAKDKGIENIDEVYDFMIKKIKVRSIDNINGFLNEVKLFGNDYTLQEILNDMNIFEK